MSEIIIRPIGYSPTETEAIEDLQSQIDNSEEAAWYEELNRGYSRDR